MLVVGVPRGALSQPWPVQGGHLCATVVDVTENDLVRTVDLLGRPPD